MVIEEPKGGIHKWRLRGGEAGAVNLADPKLDASGVPWAVIRQDKSRASRMAWLWSAMALSRSPC